MTAPIGIIGAMQVEVDLLIDQLHDARVTTAADLTFYEGTIANVPVAITRCGVGKVNAALTTQALIDRFAPARIINTGVAGALDADLEVGDLVVATDAIQHDMDVTGLGYAPGVVPEMIARLTGVLSFEADEQLAETIMRAAHEVAPTVTAVRGRIASGDLFVCTKDARERIISLFGAGCCEMEGAAIAQVCWRNHTPFVIVRTISDKADDTSKTEYRMTEQAMAEHCAAIVERALQLL